jgi:hypothetical protein
VEEFFTKVPNYCIRSLENARYTLPRNGTMVEALEAVVKHAITQVLPVFPKLRALESSV